MRHVEIAPTIPDIIPVVHSKNQIGHKVMPKVLADSKARVFNKKFLAVREIFETQNNSEISIIRHFIGGFILEPP